MITVFYLALEALDLVPDPVRPEIINPEQRGQDEIIQIPSQLPAAFDHPIHRQSYSAEQLDPKILELAQGKLR